MGRRLASSWRCAIGTNAKKGLALLAAIGAVAATYALGVRPWLLAWGSTAAERAQEMAGDEIVLDEAKTTTRAITIAAPPLAVWPWLAQLGQDRAGFYSYELLEDLVGCEMPRAETFLPEAQQWEPGDSLWMYPPRKLGGLGGAPLFALVPGRALAFGTWPPGRAHTSPPEGSWAFALEPLAGDSTRLLVRGRGARARNPLAWIFDRGVFEPAHFVMERRMMEGIRRLAEGRPLHTRAAEAGEIAAWVAMLALFAWGIGAVLRRRRWLTALGATAAAALGFQALTLLQPTWPAGALSVAILAGALAQGARRERRPAIGRRGQPIALHLTG